MSGLMLVDIFMYFACTCETKWTQIDCLFSGCQCHRCSTVPHTGVTHWLFLPRPYLLNLADFCSCSSPSMWYCYSATFAWRQSCLLFSSSAILSSLRCPLACIVYELIWLVEGLSADTFFKFGLLNWPYFIYLGYQTIQLYSNWLIMLKKTQTSTRSCPVKFLLTSCSSWAFEVVRYLLPYSILYKLCCFCCTI